MVIYIYIYTKICARAFRGARRRSEPACSKTPQIPVFPAPQPLGRSKGLLEPARCPRGARMGCSSPHSVPPERSKGLLEPPLSAPRELEGAAQACSVPQEAPSGCSSLCSVPHVRSERHFDHLLGAAGGARATSCVTGRSIRRSRMLLEEPVLGYT